MTGAKLPEPGPVYRLTLGTLTLAADRRLERAEARTAKRARALDAWDRLGCLPDDEMTGDAK